MLQLLLFSGLAFFIFLPMMKRTLTISLDFDWFYRHLGVRLTIFLVNLLNETSLKVNHTVKLALTNVTKFITRSFGSNGTLAETTSLGGMVQLVIILLALYLIIYLF